MFKNEEILIKFSGFDRTWKNDFPIDQFFSVLKNLIKSSSLSISDKILTEFKLIARDYKALDR